MPKATRIKREIKDEDIDYRLDADTPNESDPSAKNSKRGMKASNTPSKRKKPSPQPESEWRKSKIPTNTTIVKTEATTQYRLKGEDFKGISFEKKYPRNSTYQPSHIYSERDIERRAWKKHGGPEGWDFYLESLRERHRKQTATKPTKNSVFVEPVNRNDPSSFSQTEMRLRMEFKLKLGGEWIFQAAKKALWNPRISQNAEAKIKLLRQALPDRGGRSRQQTLAPYPLRPNSSLPSSPPLVQLRRALARAPKGWYEHAPPPGIAEDSGDMGNPVFDWAEDIYDDVYEALICIIQELGVGVWMDARWEVYDNYAESLGGIAYNQELGWYDGADIWLKGKVFGNMYEERLGTDTGKRYNDLLPVLPP